MWFELLPLLVQEKHNKQVQESQAGVLAPHLIQLGYVDHLSATEAKQIYRACLAKYQKRLEEMANLIQERYEKVGSHRCSVVQEHDSTTARYWPPATSLVFLRNWQLRHKDISHDQ